MNNKTAFYSYPLVISVIAVVMLLFQSDIALLTVAIIFILLAIISLIVGHILYKKFDSTNDSQLIKIEQGQAYVDSLDELIVKTLPLIAKQVHASRDHTEQEITAIINTFAEITGDIESILKPLEDNSHVQQIQDKIYSVITALQFQDRVTQMLDSAEQNIDELKYLVANNATIKLADRDPQSVNKDSIVTNMNINHLMNTDTIDNQVDEDDDITFF